MKKIKISGAINDSTVDGPGIRYVLFMQGCPHDCEGCHNPQTHSINAGREVSVNDILSDIKSNPFLTGVTFSGGEPFLQAKELIPLAKAIKEDLKLNLIIYSGWTFEELIENANSHSEVLELLSYGDILVDGRFILRKKNMLLLFKGSGNQRALDIKKSIYNKKAIELNDDSFREFFMKGK